MTEEMRAGKEASGENLPITIQSTINNEIAKVWEAYTKPEHIMQWNHADSNWHCPKAESHLHDKGTFNFRMEAKDGSEGFDFTGVYETVITNEKIVMRMDDGRRATITFEELGNSTQVSITFDPETENAPEFQRAGWQAILDNFKKHAESL